jgi:putative transposase
LSSTHLTGRIIQAMRQFRRQQIRLPLDRYGDPGSMWHVTMTVGERRATFASREFALGVVSSLKRSCENARAPLLMYCVMPDHLHALIQIEETDLITIIHNFKSFTTRLWWKHGGSGKLWQRSAYDRGIRQREYVDELVSYLFKNPIEIDLIEEWIESGLLGGELIENGV